MSFTVTDAPVVVNVATNAVTPVPNGNVTTIVPSVALVSVIMPVAPSMENAVILFALLLLEQDENVHKTITNKI